MTNPNVFGVPHDCKIDIRIRIANQNYWTSIDVPELYPHNDHEHLPIYNFTTIDFGDTIDHAAIVNTSINHGRGEFPKNSDWADTSSDYGCNPSAPWTELMFEEKPVDEPIAVAPEVKQDVQAEPRIISDAERLERQEVIHKGAAELVGKLDKIADLAKNHTRHLKGFRPYFSSRHQLSYLRELIDEYEIAYNELSEMNLTIHPYQGDYDNTIHYGNRQHELGIYPYEFDEEKFDRELFSWFNKRFN